MEIYYQGTNISDMVQVRRCILHDTAGERCDSLEIEFGNASGWYRWGPEEDDQIIVASNGYDSGSMYVNRILPEDGNYTILATSLPCKARMKACRSFYGKSLEEIMRICSAASGMDFRFYGVEKEIVIPYIEQETESCAAFLSRLLMLESAALKCVNGRYAAIGLEYAQNQDALQKVVLSANQEGTRYRRDGTTIRGLTIKTPYAEASAEDTSIAGTHAWLTISGAIPAKSPGQAARWARGKLLHMNRKCEHVVMQSTFNPFMTALTRVDIAGSTDAAGEWLVQEVEHDLIEKTTTTTMHRCIRTIR